MRFAGVREVAPLRVPQCGGDGRAGLGGRERRQRCRHNVGKDRNGLGGRERRGVGVTTSRGERGVLQGNNHRSRTEHI